MVRSRSQVWREPLPRQTLLQNCGWSGVCPSSQQPAFPGTALGPSTFSLTRCVSGGLVCPGVAWGGHPLDGGELEEEGALWGDQRGRLARGPSRNAAPPASARRLPQVSGAAKQTRWGQQSSQPRRGGPPESTHAPSGGTGLEERSALPTATHVFPANYIRVTIGSFATKTGCRREW